MICCERGMMREIKFRAWDKENLQFVTVMSIHYATKKPYICTTREKYSSALRRLVFEKIELMQYTGLHDNNGKEIYEGDLIQWNKPFGSIAEVKFGHWDNGEIYEANEWGYGWYCVFKYSHKKRIYDQYQQLYGQDIEVVGNIYENPELLKECRSY